MSDLLLELFSEEIPARMQAQAAKDLERLVVGALSDRGLLFDGAKAFAGPRRLTLAVSGLPAKQPDVKEEKKGPRVTAPAKAIEGFLRSAGVTLDDCEKRDDGKGEFYVAVIDLKGRATADVIAEFLPEVLAKLPWPKSMRWPQATNAPVRWVRPLHSILCTLDGEVVDFTFAGVTSGNTTKGHRFLSSGTILVKRFDDYVKKLREAHVILGAEERKAIIFEGVKSAAFVHGLEMIPDEGLLDEVCGLAEWPVVLVGAIEDQFMDVPPEILQTAMRTHQKYFSLREPPTSENKTGKFANRFALVANMVAEDGGKQITAGNERVLRARLSDAKFFWDQDRKTRLDARVDALANIVFHAKLGTQLERVERIEALAGEIAEKIGADVKKAKRAARLCKADLTTGVVGEFPELQGVMGRYYALNDGEDAEVADAIRDHYKPLGPNDAIPINEISIAIALADKLDTLVGFFAVSEKPTGSSDPFALRRAALGVLRILLENHKSVSLVDLIRLAHTNSYRRESLAFRLATKDKRGLYGYPSFWCQENFPWTDENGEMHWDFSVWSFENDEEIFVLHDSVMPDRASDYFMIQLGDFAKNVAFSYLPVSRVTIDVIAFFAERLKYALREKGTRHDLIDAAFATSVDEGDILRLVARVEALQAFLKTDDGTNLLAGYKRAANILKAEEKKDDHRYIGEVEESRLAEPAEQALFAALTVARAAIAPALAAEDFAGAMRTMAGLRAPVDAFFDQVKVNADDPKVRANRLNLLASLRATLLQVADFSKIEG